MRRIAMSNIYDPVSPSNTYVIYDQFHFGNKDHLEIHVKRWEQAVDQYRFYKAFNPQTVLGLCTLEYYKHLIQSYNN